MRIAPLPANDILRNLPSIINARQRLEIDVQIYCHDVMLAALSRLIDTCCKIDPTALSPTLMTALFADAYSIVDQLDLVRQVIGATPGEPGSVTKAFLDQAEDCRRIRNEMDHVSQRIPNIAGRTGTSDALFGAVSFVRCNEKTLHTVEWGEMIRCEMIIIARGTVPGYQGAAKTQFTTQDIDRPISNLRLNAAGRFVQLDRMCAQLTDILEGLSESVAASIDLQMPGFIRQTGATEQALRSATPIAVGIICNVTCPFGPAEPPATSRPTPTD